MNRYNPLTWFPGSLRLRFGVAFGVAVLLPMLLIGAVSFLGALNLNQRNLEAYLQETNLRREQALTDNIDRMLEFTTITLRGGVINRTLYESFAQTLSTGRIATTAERLRVDFLNAPQGYFDSAWLMRQNEILVQVVGEGKRFPFNTSDLTDNVLVAAADELGNREQERNLVVAPTDIGTQMFLLQAIADENGIPLGYLVLTLNLESIVYQPLQDNTPLGAYSFFLVTDGKTVLAEDSVLPKIDLQSATVKSALSGETAIIQQYVSANQQEVLGIHSEVIFFGQEFIIITEVERQVVLNQINNLSVGLSFPVLVMLVALPLILTLLLSQIVITPLRSMREAMRGLMIGRLDLPITLSDQRDELADLTTTFQEMRQQVGNLRDSMENRLHERDRDVRVTQTIIQALTGERNLDILMNRVVDLIVANFPLIYHAQIFLTEATSNSAVLKASTGAAGRALLARGHRLQIGSVSVIGQVIEQGQTIIASDIAASAVHRANEFLSETRAELAIPLRIGDTIIGALDVQSKQPAVFTEDLVTVLQTLAGQITIAIENVRLYQESQQRLADIESDKRAATRADWQSYLRGQRVTTLTRFAGNETGYDFTDLRRAALQGGKAIVGGVTMRGTVPFVVPMQLRGEILGVVEYEVSEREFRYDKVLLAEELVNRLVVSLDNARLFQESQRAAERERTVNQISAKLTGQTDIQEIIQTAIREVGIALHTPQIAVRLHLSDLPATLDDIRQENGNGHETA